MGRVLVFSRSPAVGNSMFFDVPKVWSRLNLARRFALLALFVALVSTLILGSWVAEKIEQTARGRQSALAAIYIGHFISPIVQQLENRQQLSREEIASLDAIMASSAVRLRIVGLKLWNLRGQVVYSSDHGAIGDSHPIDGALQRAMEGEVASEFNSPDAESAREFRKGHALLEIYAPIHSSASADVIAVAEFYEMATELNADISRAMLQGWLVTGTLIASVIAAFYTVVSDGSRTIERQRVELTSRISQLSDAMAQTRKLRARIERAAQGMIEENERFLKTVGSELHDRPAQLISFARLHLDELLKDQPETDQKVVKGALEDALHDIRRIAAGLLLPNIEDRDTAECVRASVQAHEQRTRTRVALTQERVPKDCPPYVKICLCRFVEEGLANAYHHAKGRGQAVSVEGFPDGILARVSDSGPGMPDAGRDVGGRLGLVGLRGRLESIRGTLAIESRSGVGTTLVAWLPIGAESNHDQ